MYVGLGVGMELYLLIQSFPTHTQKPHGAKELIQKPPASKQHHKGWRFGLLCSLLWPWAYNRA